MNKESMSIETACQLLIDYLHHYKITENRGNPAIAEMWNDLPDIPSDIHEAVVQKLSTDGCVRPTKTM